MTSYTCRNEITPQFWESNSWTRLICITLEHKKVKEYFTTKLKKILWKRRSEISRTNPQKNTNIPHVSNTYYMHTSTWAKTNFEKFLFSYHWKKSSCRIPDTCSTSCELSFCEAFSFLYSCAKCLYFALIYKIEIYSAMYCPLQHSLVAKSEI